MNEVLEWYQCRSCGRRYRWRAELVGVETECRCGAVLLCPELETFGLAVSADDTVAGTAGLTDDPPPAPPAPPGTVPDADDVVVTIAPFRPVTGAVPWHRHVNFRTLLWTLAALFGLSLAIYAAIMQTWPPIIAAAIVTPITFWRWWKSERLWQGPRSLARAVEETLADRPEP